MSSLNTHEQAIVVWLICGTLLLLFIFFLSIPLSTHTNTSWQERSTLLRFLRTMSTRIRAWASTVKGKAHTVDMGVLAIEVATYLRSGTPTEIAWGKALEKYGITYDDNRGIDEQGVPYSLRALEEKTRSRTRKNRHIQASLPVMVTLCRLSHTSGAPMADVLETCAQGISDTAEAASARDIALSGPRTSAQLLAWMPLLGIVLGAGLGVDPLAFLFGSALGRILLICGVIAETVGIIWVRSLVSSAEKAVI